MKLARSPCLTTLGRLGDGFGSRPVYTRICLTRTRFTVRGSRPMDTLGLYSRTVKLCPSCREVGTLGGLERRVLSPCLGIGIVDRTFPNRRVGLETSRGGLSNFAMHLFGGTGGLIGRRRCSILHPRSCQARSAIFAFGSPRIKTCIVHVIPSVHTGQSDRDRFGIAHFGILAYHLPKRRCRITTLSTRAKRPMPGTGVVLCDGSRGILRRFAAKRRKGIIFP